MTKPYPRTYATANALRVALDEKARERRRQTGESIETARRRFAFEAFLRRVPRSGEPWVLKGGLLLHLRYPTGPRPTKDIDAAYNDSSLAALSAEQVAERLGAALRTVAAVHDADFFSFEVSIPIKDLGADREFIGFRYTVSALLDGRIYEEFHVDCTAGDALVVPLGTVTVGERLAFVEGLEPVDIVSITPAQHVAEKLHAICRERRRESNRVKDLFDVVLLLRQGVAAQDVAAVIGEVFASAGNTSLDRLEQPVPKAWRVKYNELAEANALDVSFEEALQLHRELCASCRSNCGA